MKEAGIRDLEQGRRKPSWETVLALVKALGVDCAAFTTEPEAEPASARPRGRPRKDTTAHSGWFDPAYSLSIKPCNRPQV